METTRIPSKDQVIIPKVVRKLHHWEAGLELVVIDISDGILLKPKVLLTQDKHEQLFASSQSTTIVIYASACSISGLSILPSRMLMPFCKSFSSAQPGVARRCT